MSPSLISLTKAHTYLNWVTEVNFQPADLTSSIELRKEYGHLVRASPVTYQLGIEGKEKPWWQILVAEYSKLSTKKRMQLLQLTSDVQAEFMRAAKIQHRLYCKALRRASSAKLRKQRGWWAVEVQHNVAYHMGWLAKAQSHGVLKKLKTHGRGATKRSTRGGGVSLGQMGHRYRIMSLTLAIAKKIQGHGRVDDDLGGDAGAEELQALQ